MVTLLQISKIVDFWVNIIYLKQESALEIIEIHSLNRLLIQYETQDRHGCLFLYSTL
nr:MAG TPA: hypothetical protein [Caudoviricetes sp.]